MKKPVIAVFCKGNTPTENEKKLLAQFGDLAVAFNASTLKDSDYLTIDGVCGEVPEKYQTLPKADVIYKKYQEHLANLGMGVGGLPPQDPPQDPPEKDNSEGNNEGDSNNGGTPPKRATGFN